MEPTAYVPEWNGMIEGITRAFCAKNHWHTRAVYDMDDLLQEAWLVYNKCADRWHRAWATREDNAELVAGRKWKPDRAAFVWMYKTALRNRMIDLTNKFLRRKARTATITADLDSDTTDFFASVPDSMTTMDRIELRELIEEVPEDLRGYAMLVIGRELAGTRTEDGVRETRRQCLARQAGLEEENLDSAQKRMRKWARNRIHP